MNKKRLKGTIVFYPEEWSSTICSGRFSFIASKDCIEDPNLEDLELEIDITARTEWKEKVIKNESPSSIQR